MMLARNESFSVLRLDGDYYESTVDLLYHLYDQLSVGGFVIIDDWGWGDMNAGKSGWGAKDATLDFWKVHGIEDAQHSMHNIDGNGAWWRKARTVDVQFHRYESFQRTGFVDGSSLRPSDPITSRELRDLTSQWESDSTSAK